MDQFSKLTIENKNLNDKENDLQIGFTIDEMANRVEALLKSIGLIKDLEDLAKVYEGVATKYNFVEPTTDETKKTTYINSTSEINISKEQIDQIAAQILVIRDKIINAKS